MFLNNLTLSAWIICSIYLYTNLGEVTASERFECGVQSSEISPYKSLFVREYEYPWKAALFNTEYDTRGYFYGSGQLVNKNTILSMAHLIKATHNDDYIKNPKRLKVILGLRNISDVNEPGRKEFSIKKIVVHPNWNELTSNYDGDIAIITLTEDVTFNKYIRPICLPDERISLIETGETSSWAYIDATYTLSEIPRRKVLKMIGKRECFNKNRGLEEINWDESFCAGAEGHSFCAGSSGNGFYVRKDGKLYLRGMIAISTIFCGKPNDALNTDVLKYIDFLEENNVYSNKFDSDSVSPSDPDCGVSSVVVGHVSYGESFPHGLLPWLAALIKYQNRKQMFICGGTLVSAKTVVTAAHCVHNKREHMGLKNYELRVVLGANDLSDPHEPEKRTMRVEKIVIHSTWNSAVVAKFTGDIALLVLDRPVAFDDYIRPVCLSDNVQLVQSGVVAGWGRRENQAIGTSNDAPRKIEIPVVDHKTCYEKEPRLAAAGWDKSFCAGRRNVSVCDGDSGSGLYVKSNGRYYLRGIVSNAVLHHECVNGYYAIFTDAAKYIPFIEGKEKEVTNRFIAASDGALVYPDK